MFYFDNFKIIWKHNVGLENVLMAYSLCKNHIQCAYINRYPIMK